MSLILILLMSLPYPNLEGKIKSLAPEIKSIPQWIPDTIRKEAPKILPGVPINLILAMIQKESSFIHQRKVGNYGEWGLLQVIPWEGHIKRAALKYRCIKSEQKKWHKYKKWNNGFLTPVWNGRRAQDPVSDRWFKVTATTPRKRINGRWFVFESKKNMSAYKGKEPSFKYDYFSPCRCVKGNCSYPNIGFHRNGEYIPTMIGTMLFLRFSPRGALVTGLWELRYWKNRYERIYKKKYWTKAPVHYFRKAGYDVQKSITWWKRVKKDLGDNVWIVHHNYGGRLVLSQTARWYPYMVVKFMKQLSNI